MCLRHTHQKWPVYKEYNTHRPTHICQQHLRPKRVPIVPLCNYLSLIIRALWLIKAQQSRAEQWPDRQAVMLLLYRNHNNYLALSLSVFLSPSHTHTHSLLGCAIISCIVQGLFDCFLRKIFLCVQVEGKVLPGDLRWPGNSNNATRPGPHGKQLTSQRGGQAVWGRGVEAAGLRISLQDALGT